jgi:hypothetical protein
VAKNKKATVRSHSQEREWLVSLGKGNIVEGVRHLVQQSQGHPPTSNGLPKDELTKRKN